VVHWTPPAPLAYPIYGVTNALGRPIGAGDASGSYSFGSTACSTGDHSDPIGAVFVGSHAGVSNTADMISKHVGWGYSGQGTGDQGAFVWFHGGGFRCRANDEGMATADSFPKPQSRYHARLWLSWYPSGRPKTVATPHYEQFRYCSYWTQSPGYPPAYHHTWNHIVLSNEDGPGGDSGFDLARHHLRAGFEAAGHRTENHFEGNTLIHHQDCDGKDNAARSDGYQVTIYENHTH